MNYSSRSRHRKQKKMNRVLNIAIGGVVLLIFYIGGKLLLGPSPEEVALVNDELDQQEEVVEEENVEEDLGHGTPIENSEKNVHIDSTEDKKEDKNKVPEQEQEEEDIEPQQEDENKEPVHNGVEVNPEGPWEPIGTIQEEPFTAVYDVEHQNWQEMTEALQYATGLGEDMIIWWLGNGGDHKSAIGTVSTIETKHTPYQVRLEWVENKGWKPVSVEELEENKYLQE